MGDIYQEGELLENATTKDFLVVQQEGKRRVELSLERFGAC
jgi:hypothetical protein